ncbi:MAG: response regulator [Gemmatimonadales bacterium]|nr:response regulator [Gemmatimonadales bacterium]
MELIALAPDLVLGIAAIAGVTAFVLLRTSRQEAPPPAEVDPNRVTATGHPTTELVSSWVQFVRDHIREAVAGLNNRLNAIALSAETLRRSTLTPDQRAAVQRILQEIKSASTITGALAHRISSDAPDIPPPAWHILQDAAKRSGRVLLAEADENNRVVVARLLRSLGHDVTAVTNGREAWEVLTRDEVDCIVCDPRMPTLGGRALYEQVEERIPKLARRFVFVSGDYTDPSTHAFLEQSGQPVVGKPYELESLLQAIATVLQEMGVVAGEEG